MTCDRARRELGCGPRIVARRAARAARWNAQGARRGDAAPVRLSALDQILARGLADALCHFAPDPTDEAQEAEHGEDADHDDDD